ncbi:NAD(P)-dependent oxidoreductase [Frigoribacterium sp. VKM Ac-2530]|uniref:NAD(P)-dependent oxidoreductase n=1 Tax=Frigoribacterium sp. VKM Ac-2530 TaxID=2783822 RepID=UPI001889F42A|nr:NAD(P)H-binding protein [Frigoribacterium sp. VKM Ac-2530]MBF4580624.1 NAD(P)H-binding protein [Frigoribacterium sp. VKM Ac-2530]
MTRITVVGGTGYAGSAIVAEAARRGHEVVSVSRSVPAEEARVEGVRYETGSLVDADARARAVADAEVVVSSLSPRGELDGRIVEVDRELAGLAEQHGARFVVVGGYSSLRLEEGGPRQAETGQIPPEYAGEALQMNEVLGELLASAGSLDFTFVSPAMQFGAYAPGEALGRYRVGGEVAFTDDAGVSAVSGADFALAIVDELETPAHRREHISVAY